MTPSPSAERAERLRRLAFEWSESEATECAPFRLATANAAAPPMRSAWPATAVEQRTAHLETLALMGEVVRDDAGRYQAARKAA